MALLSALFGRGIQHFSQAFPGTRDCTTAAMRSAIVDWFHLYYADLDIPEEDPCQRLAYTIVAKLYKACFAEYAASITASGEKGDFLRRCQLELDKARKRAVQLAMIGGEAWLKPLPSRDRFEFGVVRRDAVAILARDASGKVIDMVSAEQIPNNGGWYTLLERRTVNAAGYLTIQNKLYFSRDGSSLGIATDLQSVPQYAQLPAQYTFRQPTGSIGLICLKMPMENTVDGSMDGVSVYSAANRLIHNINHNEWLMNQEFDNGAIRVIASADMLEQDPNGRKKLPTGLFVGLDEDPENVGITVFNPTLRDASFLARKTEYLRNIESVLGIKRGILGAVEAAERTAKEITSSEGDYNLTIQDLWEMWEGTNREALRLCDVLGQMYRLCDGASFDPQSDLTVSWGNGVLYDPNQEWTEIKWLVSSGVLKPELALAWKYDLPHETENDLAAIRAKYMPEMEQLLSEV